MINLERDVQRFSSHFKADIDITFRAQNLPDKNSMSAASIICFFQTPFAQKTTYFAVQCRYSSPL